MKPSPAIRLFSVACVAFLVAGGCTSPDRTSSKPLNREAREAALSTLEELTEMLGRANTEDAVILLDHKDPRVRRAAIGRLETIKDRASPALEKIHALLRGDPSPRVRSAATRALVAIADSASIESLIASLADNDRQVRFWAWKGIVAFGAEESIPRLFKHLRQDASTKMTSYENEAGDQVWLRLEINHRIPDFGGAATPFLVAGFEDDDEWLLGSLLLIIKDVGPKAQDTIPALTAYMERTANETHKLWAIAALEEMGDLHPLVMPTLQKATTDPSRKVANQAQKTIKAIQKDQKEKDKGKGRPSAAKTRPQKPSPSPQEEEPVNEKELTTD